MSPSALSRRDPFTRPRGDRMTANRLADALAQLREETRLAEAHLATLGLGRPPEATASTTPHKENAR